MIIPFLAVLLIGSSTLTRMGPKSFHSSTQVHSIGNMDGTVLTSDAMPRSEDSLKIIIAGAPAAGKGTQCERIKEAFGVVHLSTGDILRAAVKDGTPLGVKAKEYMDTGQLVPDDLIIDVVCDRLGQEDCKTKGWLLDGFPRTAAQAEALSEAGMVPDCFVLLDVPEDILVERVSGRRTDPETGKIYHMTFTPPPEDIVDRLVQRSDDTEEKIKVRYRDFTNNMDAVREKYEDCLIWVDGTQTADRVSFCINSSLESVVAQKGTVSTPSSSSSSGGVVSSTRLHSMRTTTRRSVLSRKSPSPHKVSRNRVMG